MLILGINAFHGDAAAVLIDNGRVVAAVEEERFRRVKHCAGFPRASIETTLAIAGRSGADIELFAVSRDPSAHILRKAWFGIRRWPSVAFIRDRVRNSSQVSDVVGTLSNFLGLERAQVAGRTRFVEHHPAHLASAFFGSPWEEAALCAIDGFGDFVSTSAAVGRGSQVDMVARVHFPHSLGLLYLAVTQHLGFHRYGDEFKVMGLAPYGEPSYVHHLRNVLHLEPDGAFALDLSYFRHWTDGARMTWNDGEPAVDDVFTPKLEALLGPARRAEEPLESRHEAIAASIQQIFEDGVAHVLNAHHARTGLDRLCLAGGCAMNSVMNGKIRERTPFKDVYIQPAAADNGTALGAALYVWHHVLGKPRGFVMDHAYWGPAFNHAEIRRSVTAAREDLRGYTLHEVDDDEELCRRTAERIADGKIVGWFQGRMEWGARALGNRSILADPRRPDMRDIINTKIKFREKFRPFAPSILEEALDDYFVGAVADPFMIQVYPVRPEKRVVIPAVTHVDGTGRLQTVSRQTNPLFWQLINAFAKLTGVPVLLNTSFNENEPIVHKPEEAIDCFLRTKMDVLVLGRTTIRKPDA